MLFYAKLHVAMPGISSSEETRLRDVEKRFGSMNCVRSLHPEEMVDMSSREREKNSSADHAKLQSAISTMKGNMPRRTCLRPPPGFDRNDPYNHHVPNSRVPVQSVPHSRHEAMRALLVPPNPDQRHLLPFESNGLEDISNEGVCLENRS